MGSSVAGISVGLNLSVGRLVVEGLGARPPIQRGVAPWQHASNPATTGPVAQGAQLLSTTAATIDNAPAGTGQGEWDFAADPVGVAQNLSIVIPGDASAGAYSSTLTFTTAAPVV